MFKKLMVAGWGDMDFNSHMKNTAYLDKSADIRMMFFAENGFPMDEFMRLKIGPVVMKDEIEYFKEIHLIEYITVDIMIAGLSEDGSRFIIQNKIYRADGKAAAQVTSTGGWLDLQSRKLVSAPLDLLNVLNTIEKTENFQILPTSIR